MTTTAVTRRRYSLSQALEAIARSTCPCDEEALTTSDWPTWRRCPGCSCFWKTDEINGRRYAARVKGARCRLPEEGRA